MMQSRACIPSYVWFLLTEFHFLLRVELGCLVCFQVQVFLFFSGLLNLVCFVCFSQPLPEKFVVKGVVDRFSEEFVETRRKALDKFLKRITDHPVLSFNEHFNVFLTAKVSQ